MRTSTRTLAIGSTLLVIASLATGCTADTPDPSYEEVSCDGSALTGLDLAATGEGVNVTGVIDDGELTAPFGVGNTARTILAVTGEGVSTFTLTDPQGAAVPVTWGPIQRVRTTLAAEGTEYSLGLHFVSKGCWTLTAANTSGTATLVLPVQATEVDSVTG